MEGEFNEVYDALATALSDLYLVDDRAGMGPANAVISMSRFDVSICRHHNIVVDQPAWDPDLIKVMHGLLQKVPDGWTFGIDATDFPPGQAHMVIQKDGTVFGWSEFGARTTLSRFGFPVRMGLLWSIRHLIVNCLDDIRRGFVVRAAMKAPPIEYSVSTDKKNGEQAGHGDGE
jgi:hypothetical protein